MAVIESVIWSPQHPAAGQSVKVDVCGPDGNPYANRQADYVAINGIAGSSQYLQFPLAGEHGVTVTAMSDDGVREQSIVTIAVEPPQPSARTEAFVAANTGLSAEETAWIRATTDRLRRETAPVATAADALSSAAVATTGVGGAH